MWVAGWQRSGGSVRLFTNLCCNQVLGIALTDSCPRLFYTFNQFCSSFSLRFLVNMAENRPRHCWVLHTESAVMFVSSGDRRFLSVALDNQIFMSNWSYPNRSRFLWLWWHLNSNKYIWPRCQQLLVPAGVGATAKFIKLRDVCISCFCGDNVFFKDVLSERERGRVLCGPLLAEVMRLIINSTVEFQVDFGVSYLFAVEWRMSENFGPRAVGVNDRWEGRWVGSLRCEIPVMGCCSWAVEAWQARARSNTHTP